MFSKKFFLATLLVAGFHSIAHSEVSNPSLVEAYKGKDAEWKYIEYLFIEKPKAQLNSFAQKTRAIILALAATSILTVQFKNIETWAPLKKKGSFDCSQLSSDLPTVFSAGLLSLLGFEAITNYKDASIKHETLVNFLKDWNFHKQYVPTSLIPVFNELATAFNASSTKTIQTEDVNKVFEIIQHLIEHEFSKRYEKDKKKDGDMLAVVKTVTEIGKSIK
jgi:hypothetical protein